MTVRVKICGITNLQDARAAVDAGADLLGFVFYPPSPRSVSTEQVREIIAQTHLRFPRREVQFVGVFVDEQPETVAQTLAFCGLDHAQLHGRESPQEVAFLQNAGWSAIKAFRVRDRASLAQMERYRASAYLLDTYVKGQPGGTGHRFDWSLAEQAGQYGPILLAGGLTADNVAQAVRVAAPWAVDVSSGVEASPGRKDHGKLGRFVAAAKNTKKGHP